MKLNQLSEKVKLIKTKGYRFLLGRTYFTGDDGHQNFLVFTYMLNLLILDNNKKITNELSTGLSPQKIKPVDINLAPTISNLANGRVSLKFSNSVLVQKILPHYIVILFSIYTWFMIWIIGHVIYQ